MSQDLDMFFETTIRSFLGDKAYHIAGTAYSEKNRKQWYKEVLKTIIKRIQEIDTNTRHKEMLMSLCNRTLDAMGHRKNNELEFSLCMLRLVGMLLGFTSSTRGAIINTPIYHQTYDQHYTEEILKGNDEMQSYHDKQNTITERQKIINELKKQGKTDFELSLIFNTTEYQIKKLRKNL